MDDARIRVGVDVGGTFTDIVLLDATTGRTVFGKLLTTPEDLGTAILAGTRALLARDGLALADVDRLVHATTAMTNAIIERRGADIGLITTRGFRDVLEMGREVRYDLYDLFLARPVPLVPRSLRLEVTERISADGRELLPLADADVLAAADGLKRAGCTAVAVALLHSYVDPSHERRVRDILAREMPDLLVTLSSDVAPEIGEYERTVTACANAYVQPLAASYLGALRQRLAEDGFAGAFLLMLSNGGLATPEFAATSPIHLLESGPAAGVVAAGRAARRIGAARAISFDMGGTTAKMCLLEDGDPRRASEFEAARVARFRKGSGLPLKIPVMDLIEIGAGGGSIARIDALGLLKVGPDSAGAVPGPACYGRGGVDPTVTDADLVLGYLAADGFLGGALRLDMDRARAALDRIARPLGLTVEAAAAGVHDLVNQTMASATRMYLAENGKDPAEHSLIAFGGAGPAHAYGLARHLGVTRVVVPPAAGVMSALGLLVSRPGFDLARSHVTRLDALDWGRLERLFTALEEEAAGLMARLGVGRDRCEVAFSADMRFVGQGFQVPTPLPPEGRSQRRADLYAAAFRATYAALFGRGPDEMAIEVVTWRLGVVAPPTGAEPIAAVHHAAAGRSLPSRKVYFPDHGFIDCAVLLRGDLVTGAVVAGPAIVQEDETATVVGPDAVVTLEADGHLVIRIGGGEPR